MTLQSSVPRALAKPRIAGQFSRPKGVSVYALVKMMQVPMGNWRARSKAISRNCADGLVKLWRMEVAQAERYIEDRVIVEEPAAKFVAAIAQPGTAYQRPAIH